MISELVDDILVHYGVKGMKWGVRSKNRQKEGPSNDAKTAGAAFAKAKKSGVISLSNSELKSLNERLNLEQNYAKLSYNPSTLKRGLDQMQQILKGANTVNDMVKFAESDVGKKMGINFVSKGAAARAAKAAKG